MNSYGFAFVLLVSVGVLFSTSFQLLQCRRISKVAFSSPSDLNAGRSHNMMSKKLTVGAQPPERNLFIIQWYATRRHALCVNQTLAGNRQPPQNIGAHRPVFTRVGARLRRLSGSAAASVDFEAPFRAAGRINWTAVLHNHPLESAQPLAHHTYGRSNRYRLDGDAVGTAHVS
ncbi:MAG: hypothetical protein JWN13_6904 [Betaproteobacteria bacterium]|nr:hypothetical protein [Betaproteobacteria bacterium]